MSKEDLKPNDRLQDPEYAKELGRKAGIASGKARKRKANLKKAVEEVLSLRVPLDAMAKKLEAMGLEPTMEQALALQLVTNAVNKGDPRAFLVILETIGQNKSLADKQEQRSRINRINAETKRIESGNDYSGIGRPVLFGGEDELPE